MTNPYYTCPLEAAYMAKYHNFTFGFYDEDTEEFIEMDDLDCWIAESEDTERFYLHPDSLSLLEPQDGDAFRILVPQSVGEPIWMYGYIEVDGTSYLTTDHGYREDVERLMSQYKLEIGRRNDRQFFWPITE